MDTGWNVQTSNYYAIARYFLSRQSEFSVELGENAGECLA